MQILDTLFYFVITLGILVFVHELGHFLAAKLCGMRADVFALGMGNRLFGYNRVNGFSLWKLDESVDLGNHTDYRVAAFPIGGYVKIAGMIDESFDTDFTGKSPEPWEFRAKPMWQRMTVISAGVIMNILLAILIFWGINYTQGRSIRNTTEIGYVLERSPAATAGLMVGDRILSINGESIGHWDLILDKAYIENSGQDLKITVLRDGKEAALFLPRSSIPEPTAISFGIIPAMTDVVINTVEHGMPADKLGLQPNDVLVTLSDRPIKFNQMVVDLVKAHARKELKIEWRRGTDIMSGMVHPTDDGRIGVGLEMRYNGPITRLDYSLFGALPQGLQDIVNVTKLSVQQIWQMITGKIAFTKNIGGPIKIAQIATQTAERGVVTYFGFVGLLSISLAILNILPFPALDGGHLLFLVYEAIFRREIPVKIKLVLQRAGVALLLVFMAFVLINDIINF
ncbi:MAG TPA: RIP metalloprotease RseP [Bacteroidetes bacterium]|jgi:regulator of sigma E protease|nr:RIP metalloprotease RseP [Bacteroidota bacterium]